MNKVKGNFFRTSMVSMWMNSLNTGLFTTRTVDELLWGYEDSLLVRASASSPDVEKVFGLMYKVCALPCFSWTKACPQYSGLIWKLYTSGSL